MESEGFERKRLMTETMSLFQLDPALEPRLRPRQDVFHLKARHFQAFAAVLRSYSWSVSVVQPRRFMGSLARVALTTDFRQSRRAARSKKPSKDGTDLSLRAAM